MGYFFFIVCVKNISFVETTSVFWNTRNIGNREQKRNYGIVCTLADTVRGFNKMGGKKRENRGKKGEKSRKKIARYDGITLLRAEEKTAAQRLSFQVRQQLLPHKSLA